MATVITTLTELQSACSNGGGYELGASISGVSNVTVASGKTLTLDLKTYDLVGTGSSRLLSVSGTLILNGTTGKITGGGGRGVNGGAIYINGGTVIMNGGNITGNSAEERMDDGGLGGGVAVWSGSTFTMNGGSITENYGEYSAGVFVHNTSTFTMTGGTITNNHSGWNAGGVEVNFGGTFTMEGGSITENIATGFGGGVYSSGTFTMTGGTITGNTSSYSGGGVFTNGGTFTMTVGNIIGNTSSKEGCVYVASGVVLNVSGTAIIKDNIGGDIYKQGTISIAGEITNDADIRITYPTPALGGTICSNPNNYTGVNRIISTDGTLMGGMSGTNVVWVPYEEPPEPVVITLPVNVNGVWKDAVPKVYASGSWHDVIGIWANVSGEWKVVEPKSPKTVEITATAGSNGTISPSGTSTVTKGESITYTITPNTGYRISSILVDGVSVSISSTYTFTNVQENHIISASFTAQTFTITASAGTGGTISPSGSVSVNYNSSKTFTISPSSGYAVNAVTVDGVSQGAITSFKFSNVTSDHTISAAFKKSIDTGVYTISWTESSTSKNISWSGDAAGMTEAQRLAKIKEHSHFAVVHWDGSKPAVDYWLYNDNLNYRATDESGQVSSGVASDLTGTDGDVMMLYETVWWKVTTSGSGTSRKNTISFTWDKSKTDSTWVSPHHYGDSLSATTYAQYVGTGVFEAFNQNSQMRSINTSSQPTTAVTQNKSYNAAINGRNWQYNNKLPMTYAWYIICLYFVKGDRNCQNAYGNGIVSGSKSACNANWSATNPWINGTTANQTTGVTALGLHNPWGNVYEFLGECRNESGTVKFSALCGKDHYNIESGTASTWVSATGTNTSGDGYTMTGIVGSSRPQFPFFATAVSGFDRSVHYADAWFSTTWSSARCAVVGGNNSSGLQAGPLNIEVTYTPTEAYTNMGARLHVVII